MKNTIRKTKRKLNKIMHKDMQLLISILIIIALVSLVFSLLDNPQPEPIQNNAKYEITETDIFNLENFNANDISVMGVKVGDRTKQVLEFLGNPDIEVDLDNGKVNYEYSKAIDLEETGLILSMNNGILESITVREPFNEYLTENTKINIIKDDVYNMYGIPDQTIFMPLDKDSAFVIRIMRYETMGLDFIIRSNQVIGFSLILNDGTKTYDNHTAITIPSSPEIII